MFHLDDTHCQREAILAITTHWTNHVLGALSVPNNVEKLVLGLIVIEGENPFPWKAHASPWLMLTEPNLKNEIRFDALDKVISLHN